LNAPTGAVDYHPAVATFFAGKDPFIREVVLPNIEANRKSDADWQVVTADGQPLAGAKVSAELKRHEFLFGHCDLAAERDLKRRKLLADLFNYTCPGNATKWRAFAKAPEENDFSKIDAMLDFCRERDIVLEWHFLSGYHPAWLETVTPDSEKARFQMENGRRVLKRYHDKVRFFQVINEDRLPRVDELKMRYPGINFISMHAHKPRQLWASPKEMYETYDPYLDTGIKVHVTEFGIILGEITGEYRSGEWDEEKLAEYFVQAMATAYSHKAVRVFNLWPNYEEFTGNTLFAEDGEPNGKYRAIESLLHDKLATRVAGRTDEAGRCAFRGFHGTYDVSLQLPSGQPASAQIVLGNSSTAFKLIWNEQTGALRVVRAPET
jgi:GH35 family endo-1,4-beta-xylanase